MGETVASAAALDASVSFGRFESDSLSWDRWSSFSQNKYLEEVEKCATPGSVAKKAAYFEAHYRKIAARKAELLDQEKQVENGLSGSDGRKCEDLIGEVGKGARANDRSGRDNFSDEVVEEGGAHGLVDELGHRVADDEQSDDTIAGEDHGSPVEEVKEEQDTIESQTVHSPNPDKLEEDALVKVGLIQEVPGGSPEAREIQLDVKSNGMATTSKVPEETARLGPPRKPQKMNPASREKGMLKSKKKLDSPVAKTPRASATRASKLTPTPSTKPSPKSLAKKETPSLPHNKSPSTGEIKKISPKTPSISITSGSVNFRPSDPPASAKSLIMEKMADKEIIKRAFKTFQNSAGLSKSLCGERSSVPKPAPSLVTEATHSTSVAEGKERKEKEGLSKAGAASKKFSKIPSSSSGLRSGERADKRKEFSKKLEEKSTIREVERTRLQSKPKDKKVEEVRKLRQSLNFKATPLPAFYTGQTRSKNYMHKGGYRSEICG